jgi:hypothetical protein
MSHADEVDRLKLELERERIATDATLRREEMSLRERELKAKEIEAKHAQKSSSADLFKSPLTLALIGLLGTGVGATLQGFWNARLEKQKFESEMIKLALQEGTQEDKALFLNFLHSTQIVTLFELKNVDELAKKGKLPTLAAASEGSRISPFEQTLTVREIRDIQKLVCVPQDGILGLATRASIIRYLMQKGSKDATSPNALTARDMVVIRESIDAGQSDCK